MSPKQHIDLLNPVLKLQATADSTSKKIDSIIVGVVELVKITNETSKEIKTQTSILTDIRDILKEIKLNSTTKGTEKVKGMSIGGAGKIGMFMVISSLAIASSSLFLKDIYEVSPKQLLTAIAISIALMPITNAFLNIYQTLRPVQSLGERAGGFVLDKMGAKSSPLQMSPKSAIGMTFAIITGSIISIVAASYLLQAVGSPSISQLGTAFLIGLSLQPMALTFIGLITALKKGGIRANKAGIKMLGITAAALIVMVSAIAGIAYALELLPPSLVEPPEVMWVLQTGFMLWVFSSSFAKVIKATKGMKIKDIVMAAMVYPIMALAIIGIATIFNYFGGKYENSPPLEWSLETSLVIAVFSISYTLITKKLKGISTKEMLKGAAALIFISLAIVGTAYIFNYLPGNYIAPPLEWTLKSALAVLVFGAGFAAVLILFKKAGVSLKDIFISGTLGIIAVSVAILATAWVFSALPGDFVSPPMEWALSSAIALTLFSIPVIVIGLIASSGIGAAGILLGVVGMIVIAAGMLAVAWIFNYMPDLGAIGQNITNGLLAPVNGIVNLLARFKNEIGIENLLPLAGGIVAISGSLLVLAGATAGVAAAGLGSALMDVGKAFLSWVSGKKTEGPMEILLKLANNYAKISALANPLNSVADSFVKFSKYANISQVESINALIKSVVEPITPDHAKSLGISNITDYMNTYATTVNKVANAYGLIANHSKAMNVEAIQSTTEMFKALAYLATVGKDTALKELGDKLVSAVKELALMIADFEGTVKEAGEQNIEANSGVGSAITDLKGAIGSLFGSKSGTGTSNVNIDTSEVVDAIEKLERKLTSVGVKVNNNI